MSEKPQSSELSHEHFVSELTGVFDSIIDASAKEEVIQACINHQNDLLTEQQIDDAYHPALHHNQVHALQNAAKPLIDEIFKMRVKYPEFREQFEELHQLLWQCSLEVVKEVIGTTETSETQDDDNIKTRVEKTLEQ